MSEALLTQCEQLLDESTRGDEERLRTLRPGQLTAELPGPGGVAGRLHVRKGER